MKISLEYRPCKCPRLDGAIPGSIPPHLTLPESFDSEKTAAFRFKEHKESRRPKFAIHCQGVHVKAVIIGNTRYEEKKEN